MPLSHASDHLAPRSRRGSKVPDPQQQKEKKDDQVLKGAAGTIHIKIS